MPQFSYEGELILGKDFLFSPKESAHLKVFRVRIGDRIKVFSPVGRFEAVIKDFLNEGVLACAVSKIIDKPQKPKIKLYFSFLEKNAFEEVLRKATEAGCDVFIPAVFKYTQINHIFDISARKERFKEIILSAVKQCERTSMPAIFEPVNFEEIFSIEKMPLIFSKTDCNGRPSVRLPYIIDKLEDEVALIVGPEGGFTSQELYFAKERSIFVSLGENVLRSETAAAVACALLRALK